MTAERPAFEVTDEHGFAQMDTDGFDAPLARAASVFIRVDLYY
jgi:hypothetical protein